MKSNEISFQYIILSFFIPIMLSILIFPTSSYPNLKDNDIISKIKSSENQDEKIKMIIGISVSKEANAESLLLELLNNDNDNATLSFISASLVIYSPQKYYNYLGKIISIINDSFNSMDDRLMATKALLTVHYYLKEMSVLKYIIRILRSEKSEEIILLIIDKLSQVNDPDTKRILAQHLTHLLSPDSSEEVRTQAIKTLSKLKSIISFDAIKQLLNDNDENIRIIAIDSIIHTSDSRALPILYSLSINDESFDIRKKAKSSLEYLIKSIPGKRSIISGLLQILEQAYKAKTEQPIQKLEEYLTTIVNNVPSSERNACLTPFLKAIKHSNPKVRKISAICLGFLGENKAVRILRQIFHNDKDIDVRNAAQESLKKLGFYD